MITSYLSAVRNSTNLCCEIERKIFQLGGSLSFSIAVPELTTIQI